MVKTRARKRGSRRRGRRPGQALVEFALIAPIFILLILGVVQFTRAYQIYVVLTDAAREGARTAVLARPSITMDTVVARVNTHLASAALDTAGTIKTVTGFKVAGGSTRVSLSYPYTMVWLQSIMGWTGAQASFNMNTYAEFRNEF